MDSLERHNKFLKLLRFCTGHCLHPAATLPKMKSRYRTNALALHQLCRIRICIAHHFDKHDVGILFGKLFKERGDNLARAAPCGGVVDHDQGGVGRVEDFVHVVGTLGLDDEHTWRRGTGRKVGV